MNCWVGALKNPGAVSDPPLSIQHFLPFLLGWHTKDKINKWHSYQLSSFVTFLWGSSLSEIRNSVNFKKILWVIYYLSANVPLPAHKFNQHFFLLSFFPTPFLLLFPRPIHLIQHIFIECPFFRHLRAMLSPTRISWKEMIIWYQ